MHTIHLHGLAAQRFGAEFRLDVRDAPEAVRALSMQIPGFRDMVLQSDWRIVRGPLAKNGELDEHSLKMAIGRAGELHLIPVAAGSASGKGAGKVIVGVALAALSFALPAGAPAFLTSGLFGLGVSVGLAGVAQTLAKTPQVKDIGDREANPATKLFNGAVNLTEAGNPYPLALGRKVRVGSVVGQAGLTTEQF